MLMIPKAGWYRRSYYRDRRPLLAAGEANRRARRLGARERLVLRRLVFRVIDDIAR